MVGVLPSRTRFFDLGPQCKVEAFQPIAGIWKTDILCQIVCQLVTNKPKQDNDWRQYQKRSQTKTRFDRSEKDCGKSKRNRICNRGRAPVLQKKTGKKLD